MLRTKAAQKLSPVLLTGAFETMAPLGEWEVIKKFREYSELKKIVLTIFLWSMQRQKKAGRRAPPSSLPQG